MRSTELILASGSPRRKMLLLEAGYAFRVVSLDVDETVRADMPAEAVAGHLAERKVMAAVRSERANAFWIAADTVVALEGRILGKPADAEEAVAMLSALSGKRHVVITGVALGRSPLVVAERSDHTAADVSGNRAEPGNGSLVECFSVQTTVEFAELSPQAIASYVKDCEPFDKAGAYAIQERIGMLGIRRIEGCYYNVVGLPMQRLGEALKCHGILPVGGKT